MKTALLTGATGVVGRALLARLEAHPAYSRLTVAARRPDPARAAQVDWRVVDFDQLGPQLEGLSVDHAFCALGTTRKQAGSEKAFRKVDLDYAVATARAARAAGARRFVLCSSVGAEAKSSNLYLRTKGEAEEAITALGFEAVHFLRPSLLLALRTESRPGEAIARALLPSLGFALVGRARRYRAIAAETVAEAMLGAALRDQPGVFVHEYDALGELAKESAATPSR